MTGRLILAATPIGNADDASPRLREALATADVVAAEDTRRVRDLARRLDVTITGTVLAVHDHNERSRSEELVARASAGETVLLVSDAGMPTVSDPGFASVRAAIQAGVPVTTLPGPSAVLAALAVSGIATDKFVFEGFAPRKQGERVAALAEVAGLQRTLVFFESPRRLGEFLADAASALGGQRQAAVCRELTKTHEQVMRGTLAELASWAGSVEVLGEVVVVVEGRSAHAHTAQTFVDEVLERVAAGERLKEVAREVAQAGGVSARELYAAALNARSGSVRQES